MFTLFALVLYFFIGFLVTAFFRLIGVPGRMSLIYNFENCNFHGTRFKRLCPYCWTGGRRWNLVELLASTIWWPFMLISAIILTSWWLLSNISRIYI